MLLNQDIKDLFNIFNKNNVKYILVGGYAVMHDCEPRYTKDIDLFILANKKNSTAIRNSLKEFGIPLKTVSKNIFMEPGNFFKFGAPPWRVDLITSLKGLEFEEAFSRSSTIKIEGLNMQVISKDDLIKVKKIAGRPLDLIDVESLEKSK